MVQEDGYCNIIQVVVCSVWSYREECQVTIAGWIPKWSICGWPLLPVRACNMRFASSVNVIFKAETNYTQKELVGHLILGYNGHSGQCTNFAIIFDGFDTRKKRFRPVTIIWHSSWKQDLSQVFISPWQSCLCPSLLKMITKHKSLRYYHIYYIAFWNPSNSSCNRPFLSFTMYQLASFLLNMT